MTHIVSNGDHTIEFDLPSKTVKLSGTLRLNGMEEYAPLLDLMQRATEESGNELTIDLRDLRLLNSSGITTLSKYIIACRDNSTRVILCASPDIPWQVKSLKNLQRLMPSIELQFF